MTPLLVAFALVLLASTPGTPASAQNYQPLDVGTHWIYGSPDGMNRDTIVVVGPTEFDGLNAVEFQYHGFNAGLSNFWTVTPDGGVLFHGFDRPAESFGVRYDPPIRMVQTPALVGRTWRDTVYDDCFRSPCDGDTLPTMFLSTVNGIGPLTVPAGSFTAAAIELDLDFVDAQLALVHPGYSIFGTKVSSRTTHVEACCGQVRWWVDGVGLVQDYDDWKLLSFDRTATVRATSWGMLKSRYR